jgi:hypothetical protein
VEAAIREVAPEVARIDAEGAVAPPGVPLPMAPPGAGLPMAGASPPPPDLVCPLPEARA